jgi:transcriptional regulator with PAS, ATPase and Fis domain
MQYLISTGNGEAEFRDQKFAGSFEAIASYLKRNNGHQNELRVIQKQKIECRGLSALQGDYLVVYPFTRNNEVLAVFVAMISAPPHLIEDRDMCALLADLLHVRLGVLLQNGQSSESSVKEKEIALLGSSPAIREVRQKISFSAQTCANILIYGESGTGKELVARSIHQCSHRASFPFIGVDCVSLPPSLIESELFGFEKGAFTGANKNKEGLLEMANGGTFFLDEITELGLELQAKLLRVLQERHFRRVGGSGLRPLNIRVVAATNVRPEMAVSIGKLREDLYYRLNVVPLYLPPLRERRDDIPLLVEVFSDEYAATYQMKPMTITAEAMNCLCSYSWPGNVRELKNVIERILILSGKPVIELDDLPIEIRMMSGMDDQCQPHSGQDKSPTYIEGRSVFLNRFEQNYFAELLKKHHGNISKVADEAGLSRKTLYQRLRGLQLEYRKFRIE